MPLKQTAVTLLSTVVFISVVVLTGCGGGDTKTVVKTVTTETTPTSTTPTTTSTPEPARSASCDAEALGQIGPAHPRVTCQLKGATIRVASKTVPLGLKSLSATLVGVRTADSVSAGSGATSATAHGRFVIITLRVRNRLDSPQSFGGVDANQTALLLPGRKVYTESFEAENEADATSFLSSSDSAIQPDETRTGDVVFDLPQSRASKVATTSKAALLVVNFGDDVNTATAAGMINLRH